MFAEARKNMSRKIIFIASPLGMHKRFVVDKAEEIFNITENEKRLYFTLGTGSQLVSEKNVWPDIQNTVDNHLTRFPESTFIYYGWQVLEYLDDLRKTYPDANYFGYYTVKDHGESVLVEILANLYDIPHDETSIRNKMNQHFDRLEEFYNLGQPAITMLHGYEGKEQSRKCFFIN